jgi:hypothetical protein
MSGNLTFPISHDSVYLVDVESSYDSFQLRRTEARTFRGLLVEAPRPQPIVPLPGSYRITIRLAGQVVEATAPKDRLVGDFMVALSLFLRLTAFIPNHLHLLVDGTPLPYDSTLGDHRLFNLSGFNEIQLVVSPVRAPERPLASDSDGPKC